MMNGGAELWQICLGVFVSSIFSALLEPSYRATVTDLLEKEEYSKASGMVSLAGSTRYLISPILAGALLAVSDIKLLLLIDICTFSHGVRRGIRPEANCGQDIREKISLRAKPASGLPRHNRKSGRSDSCDCFLCYDLLYGVFSDSRTALDP